MPNKIYGFLWRTLVFFPWGFYYVGRIYEDKVDDLILQSPIFNNTEEENTYNIKIRIYRGISMFFDLTSRLIFLILAFYILMILIR